MTTQDVGAKSGKNYSINFPLKDGIDDMSYQQIFRPVRRGCGVFVCGMCALAWSSRLPSP